MKPYQRIPIIECGERLVQIPLDLFAVEEPHPYVELAAPYGTKSPYYLRQEVLEHLITAQDYLQQQRPGWKIQIFDAYRPIAVQQFMVEYTFIKTVEAKGISLKQLTDDQRQVIWNQVYQFWAIPSFNSATPPPHSTGAALDVTLVDARGQAVDMGSPIDEMSSRSCPDYFATPALEGGKSNFSKGILTESSKRNFHQNRQLLHRIMVEAEFRQHPGEWWHFSLGDQMWAWLMNRESLDTLLIARYGAV